MPDRPRILVLEGAGRVADLLQPVPAGLRRGAGGRTCRRPLALLREQHFDAFCADPGEAGPARTGRRPDARRPAARRPGRRRRRGRRRAADHLGQPGLRRPLRRRPVRGRGFYDALGTPEILGPDYSPFHTALAGRIATTRLHCRDDRYLELHVTPDGRPRAPRRRN